MTTSMPVSKQNEQVVSTAEPSSIDTGSLNTEENLFRNINCSDTQTKSNEPIDISGDGGILKKILIAAPVDSRGPPPPGSKVKAHYTGTLVSDGSKFDSSIDRGEPFEFTIGQGQVIKGWEKGFATMRVGEKAKLTIRSDYGYGDAGSPPKIPSKADLNFDVELIDYVEKGEDDNYTVNNTKKEKWDMSDEEKKVEAKKLKEEGTEHFKNGKYSEAAEKYKEAAEYINDDEDAEDSPILDDAKELYINCLNNAAMCSLKIRNYAATVSACSNVLKVDQTNLKALYRRGVANMKQETSFRQRKIFFMHVVLTKKIKLYKKLAVNLRMLSPPQNRKRKTCFPTCLTR